MCRGGAGAPDERGVCALTLNPARRWQAEAACLGSLSIHTVFAVLLLSGRRTCSAGSGGCDRQGRASWPSLFSLFVLLFLCLIAPPVSLTKAVAPRNTAAIRGSLLASFSGVFLGRPFRSCFGPAARTDPQRSGGRRRVAPAAWRSSMSSASFCCRTTPTAFWSGRWPSCRRATTPAADRCAARRLGRASSGPS